MRGVLEGQLSMKPIVGWLQRGRWGIWGEVDMVMWPWLIVLEPAIGLEDLRDHFHDSVFCDDLLQVFITGGNE